MVYIASEEPVFLTGSEGKPHGACALSEWVDAKGVVTAVDMRREHENDCDIDVVVEAIRSTTDSRIKYMIWNRRMCSPKSIGVAKPWEWRSYSGAPQGRLAHFSVPGDASFFDEKADWVIE